MTAEELNELARLLVQNVRDLAIRSCDVPLYTDNLKSPTAKRWNDAKNDANIDKFAEMIISDSVDEALFYLLMAIDQGLLNFSFNSLSGNSVNLATDGMGELAGSYMGEWRSEFSKERYSEDFPS